jgi:hypothetical protein
MEQLVSCGRAVTARPHNRKALSIAGVIDAG